MNFELNQENLFNFLQNNKLNPEIQKETSLLFITQKIDVWDVPVFFNINDESGLLQILGYLPFQLEEKHFSQVARLLHMINRQFDMPGFGMDEEHKLLFYRSVLPTLDHGVDERLVNTYIKMTALACATFIHAIGLVASGFAKPEDIFNKSDKNSKGFKQV